MRRWLLGILALVCLTTCFTSAACFAQTEGLPEFRKLYVSDYRDKMEAGWLGQIIGVCWGTPTEFKWVDVIIPEKDVPAWSQDMLNYVFKQDDLYVEMTFLRTLEQYGLDCSIRQAGIDFANSEYQLWCANLAGRTNLRNGIAPPDSSHPQFNKCPNDIDYQIEADYSGLISPGMPNRVIALGEKFGRLMNYSDGVYGGVFMGGMYAEAFFTDDIDQILDAGLACIPADSQYAEMVRDVRAWHKENPTDWEATWSKCIEKYRKNPDYQKCSNGPIDVKINGACVVLGLLYGQGDIEKTTVISMRAGFDSDCNPSSSCGVICTPKGAKNIPERWIGKLDYEQKFSYTEYSIPGLIDVCEKLARQSVLAEGGKIESDEKGEYFLIPVKKAQPMPLTKSWEPGPIANSKFTDEELAQLKFRFAGSEHMQEGVDLYFPGWKVSDCGPDMAPGFCSHKGKQNVLKTHPKDAENPCVLSRTVEVPEGKTTTLKLCVAAYEKDYDWELVVRVDGRAVLDTQIGNYPKGWNSISLDLTPYAGRTIELKLENKSNDWAYEAGYWSQIDIVSE